MMKLINGVRIVMKDPGHPASVEVYLQKEGEEQNLTEGAIVHWPIDIHIDEKGVFATLRIRLHSLEIAGIAFVEEPAAECDGKPHQPGCGCY